MDDSELPLLRLAHCGCMIPADARPADHPFKTTSFALGEVHTACGDRGLRGQN
ncbi:MAG: hypothetical protein ACYDA0_14010 [Candidatus Dormibacteraceae bacterium]